MAEGNNIAVQAEEIYQAFLAEAKRIEKERDNKIAALYGESDAARIAQILKDIKARTER